jgi:PAS domain-containing protein
VYRMRSAYVKKFGSGFLASIMSFWGTKECQQQEQTQQDDRGANIVSSIPFENKSTVTDDAPQVEPVSRSPTPPLLTLDSDQWVEILPRNEHVEFFKATNWDATPLGCLNTWPIVLRLYTCQVLADSQAATIYWGPERVAIYNEAFIPLAGKLHPNSLMGVSFNVAFAELVEPMTPVFQLAETSGRAADVKEMEMFVERNKFLEETYFSGNFTPLRGPSGRVEGFYNAVHEITKAMINDRKRAMLNLMEAPPAADIKDLSDCIIPFLELNPRDIPLALLYKADEDTVPGTCLLSLHGKIGIPDGHPLALELVDLSSADGLAPFLRKSRSKITTIAVDENFIGVDWKGYGEASSFVNILPIIGLERLFGFLVVGTNSRRPIDEDHHQFMRDLSTKVSSIFGAIMSTEETRKRAERLERQLADSMKQIRYMAENASVGMAYVSPDGIIRWANPRMYTMLSLLYPIIMMKLGLSGIFFLSDLPKALYKFLSNSPIHTNMTDRVLCYYWPCS